MRATIALLLSLLAACSDSQSVDEAIANSGQATGPRPVATAPSAPLDPGSVPVRIGEGGPGFPACQTAGRVVATQALAIRRAPFAEAAEIDRLPADARVAICARSIDQRWLGVVYPPAGAPDTDCGVAAPVERRRGYDGPCRSGWTASAFIRLIAR